MTELLIRCFIRTPQDARDPRARTAYGLLAGWVGVALNLLLGGAKLLVGTLTGSISIQADAVNNLSDVGASAVTVLGFHMAGKPADAEHPFGHGRVEYVAGLAVSFLILLVGVELLKEAADRILAPVPVRFSWPAVAVLAGSMLAKLWMGGFTAAVGKRIQSPAMAAARADCLSDVAATGAVLAATLLSRVVDVPLDGYMGVLAALFVLYTGLGILKDTASPLMGEAPSPALVRELSERLTSYEGINGIHDLIIHQYGPGCTLATVHAEVSGAADLLEIHETIDKAEREIGRAMRLTLTIHMDPIPVDDAEAEAARGRLQEIVAAIDPRLSFHDFRMAPGDGQLNLVFDLVTPFGESRAWASAVKRRVKQEMRAADPRYHCAITLDSSYS